MTIETLNFEDYSWTHTSDFSMIYRFLQKVIDSDLELAEQMDLIERYVLNNRDAYFAASAPLWLTPIFVIFLFNEWDNEEKQDWIRKKLQEYT